MRSDKLEELSALEIGTAVLNKEVKAVEVIDYFAERIKERNPSINAFVYTKFDEAREDAEKIQDDILKGENPGVFAGVPVGLKDFLPSKKGWPASHGGVKSFQTIDEEDGEIYSGMKRLGCIAVGKTNAPAFGFRATTDNKLYGPTSTPFNTEYNSGGSSGGSAAAVADGLVPLAETGDAGGSTRVPSSWCGVFGFKPSAGVIPNICRPDAWTATHPYCSGFAATRTIEDAAILFDELRCHDLRDPLSVPNSFSTATSELGSSIKDLKIGYTLDFNMFPDPDEEIQDVIYSVVKMLEKEVASVVPVTFNHRYPKNVLEDAWLRGINIDDATSPIVDKLIERHPEDLPDALIKWNKIAKESTLQDYLEFHKVRTAILDSHLEAFKDCDIIIAPVTGCMPVKNSSDKDTKGPEYISGVKVDPLIGFAYTYLENMTGFPAASVPVGISTDTHLPIGLQVIAKRYDDNLIFRLSYALEKLNPWNYNIPFNRM